MTRYAQNWKDDIEDIAPQSLRLLVEDIICLDACAEGKGGLLVCLVERSLKMEVDLPRVLLLDVYDFFLRHQEVYKRF